MEATVQVRKRGVLTLSAELREKYGIGEGDTFRIVDVDGVFVLTPMAPFAGMAHPKDLPILVTAVTHDCAWLVTFNVKDYQPGWTSVGIVRLGDFVLLVRQQLAQLVGIERRQ